MKSMGKLLSVVIPACNEEGMVERAAQTIQQVLERAQIPCELIFVDDGSRDGTWEKIQAAAARSSRVRGVGFSRNFGKEAAMFAGMSCARGDCCCVIDCDLQHPPEKMVEMYRLWEQGYPIVEAVKTDRGREAAAHTLGARCFYWVLGRITGVDMSCASDFKLLDRRAVDVLLSMRERNTFFRALSAWIGFRTAQVEFQVQERTVGRSKWSVLALVRYAVSNVSAFSAAPMQLVTLLGALMLAGSAVLGCAALYDKLTGVAPEGFTTVIIIQLFTGSIIMISLGIIGYYISRIYEEVKDRPRYIISRTCGEEASQT